MSHESPHPNSKQSRWSRFRFSVIGPLLSAPPQSGKLQQALVALSQKQWQHPITGHPVCFSVSTLERWYYQARQATNPVEVLRSKRRADAGSSRQLSTQLKSAIQQQYQAHPSWSYQLHVDNLATKVKQSPELGQLP